MWREWVFITYVLAYPIIALWYGAKYGVSKQQAFIIQFGYLISGLLLGLICQPRF